MTRARRATLYALGAVVVSCGGSGHHDRHARVQAVTVPAPVPSVEVAGPPKPWEELIAREGVWRRPDLDASCARGTVGYFLPEVRSESHTDALTARELGCSLRPDLSPGLRRRGGQAIESFGAASCCPRSLGEAPLPHSAGIASCEQAILEFLQSIPSSEATSDEPRPTAGQFGAVLNVGAYFQHCDVPDTTEILICSAIRDGRAVGVTVRTKPVAAHEADCVAASVLGLRFPASSLLDVTRTQF